MRIQHQNISHVVVRFDTEDVENAVGDKQVVSAKLELFIETNFGNWGSGRYVDARRLDVDWLEMSSTWSCPDDTNLANSSPDCPIQWNGGTYNATATASVFHANASAGYQLFEVASDLLPAVDGRETYGWLLKKRIDTDSGSVDYTSVQGVASQRPKLVLELADSALIDVASGSYYDHSVTTTLYSQFLNMGYAMTLNGGSWSSGNTVSADGNYTVEIFKSNDPSSALRPIVFTIDTTAPVIQFVANPGGGVPLVHIVDENPDSITQQKVDGSVFNRSDGLTGGAHVLNVTVKDRAGNETSGSTSFNMPLACEPQTYIDYVLPTATLSAAHYYVWHTNGNNIQSCPTTTETHNRSWCYCIHKPKNITPYVGFYSSSDSAIVANHIAKMKAKYVLSPTPPR